MEKCIIQDICKEYASGDNKPPNHHVRATVPCAKWLSYSCPKMSEVLVLQQFATGSGGACSIVKRKKVMEGA